MEVKGGGGKEKREEKERGEMERSMRRKFGGKGNVRKERRETKRR